MSVDTAAVLDRYDGRVSERSMAMLRSAEAGGEYGVMTGELLATLVAEDVPVTNDERTELRHLTEVTGEGSEYLPRLTVAASAG